MTERRPTANGVRAAADRIAGQVTRTPLLPLDMGGRRLWVKAECLQQGGSFKLRGATNRLLAAERGGAGARRRRFLLRQPCPGRGAGGAAARHRRDDRHAGRRAGGEGRGDARGRAPRSSSTTARPRAARRSARGSPAERGATLVPSFDDVDVIEGQGSVGVEIADAARRARPPMVIVPCGGGGLSAGIALALPETQIVVVEPEGWDDMAPLARGRRDRAGRGAGAADPLRRAADQAGLAAHLRRAARRRRARASRSARRRSRRRWRFAFRHLRIVAEPGGAVALAALARRARRATCRTARVVVVSGGNVDPALYAEILRGAAAG